MNYRHGDLALIGIEKLPDGLIETQSKIIMTGSGGNDHTFNNGRLFLKNVNQFIIGYFEAFDNTKLFHVEHGEGNSNLKEATIEKGFYEIRKQCEDTHEGMRPIQD